MISNQVLLKRTDDTGSFKITRGSDGYGYYYEAIDLTIGAALGNMPLNQTDMKRIFSEYGLVWKEEKQLHPMFE